MLTKDQIREKLLENPNWEPAEEASQKEWEAYDEIYEELLASGEIAADDDEDGAGLGGGDDDWDDGDDDAWGDEE